MSSRLPAMHTAVVALALCSCFFLLHAAETTSLSSPGLRESDALASHGASDQVVAGEAEEAVAGSGGGANGRMGLELEDYPGSGANDRHSPWGMQRRN